MIMWYIGWKHGHSCTGATHMTKGFVKTTILFCSVHVRTCSSHAEQLTVYSIIYHTFLELAKVCDAELSKCTSKCILCIVLPCLLFTHT